MRNLALLALAATLALGQGLPFIGTIRGSAAQGQVLYATTASGGYFRSTDSGATWAPMYVTEAGLAQPPFQGLAVDHVRESTVYVATTPAAGGVWKSTDAGATWSRANTGLPATGAVTNTRLFLVSNGDLYLRLDTALYKSSNGAATWTRLERALPGNSAPFDINFTNPRQMFYAQQAAVWRSTDEGANWQLAGALRTFGDATTGAACLVTDPQYPNRVYICVAGPLFRVGDAPVTGLHRSTDGGGSLIPPATGGQPTGAFVDATGGPLVYLQNSAGGYCKSNDYGQTIRCPADSTLVPNIVPTSGRLQYLERRNANVVWAIANRFGTGSAQSTVMLRSRDAGETWQVVDGRAKATLGRPVSISATVAPGSSAVEPLAVASPDIPTAAMPFTVTTSGEAWFTVNRAGGTTPAALTVTLRTEGLAAGSRHEGWIRVEAPEAANMAVTIPVVLQVGRLSTGPAPLYSGAIFAGNGTTAFSGDGGPATEAGISDAREIAADRAGNILFIANGQARIRRVNPSGRIDTVVGTGANAVAANGTAAAQAPVNFPRGLAVDPAGTIFYGESSTVRQLSNGTVGTAIPSSASLTVAHLAVDPLNRLWIAGGGGIARYVPPASATRLPLTQAPTGTTIRTDGFAIDGAGNFYVSDSLRDRVYRISSAGLVTLYAGNGTEEGQDAAPATATGLDSPTSLAVDRKGNLFLLESTRQRIRVVTPEGFLYTVSPQVEWRTIRSLAVDGDGNLYASTPLYLYKFTPQPTPPPNVTGMPKNGASGAEQVSPGTLFTVDGEYLANIEETGRAETLGGAAVAINGKPVMLEHAGANRLSGQIPGDLEPGTATLTVTVNGVMSNEVAFPLLPLAPGIYSGPGDTLVENGEASLLITGFGAVDEGGKAVTEFQVRLGELEPLAVEVHAVEGRPGLGRAKFRLPEGLASGEYAVTLVSGEIASNTVTITVPEPM